MSFYGMDVSAVQQLAQQMNNAGSEIQQLMTQLTSALENTQWVGPDHDRFLSEWHSQYCAQLNNVVHGLEQASQLANSNAQQQLQASQAAGG
ncbi:MAG: WXG100 family type VII secretion target [Acidimicrobiales bacterium]